MMLYSGQHDRLLRQTQPAFQVKLGGNTECEQRNLVCEHIVQTVPVHTVYSAHWCLFFVQPHCLH